MPDQRKSQPCGDRAAMHCRDDWLAGLHKLPRFVVQTTRWHGHNFPGMLIVEPLFQISTAQKCLPAAARTTQRTFFWPSNASSALSDCTQKEKVSACNVRTIDIRTAQGARCIREGRIDPNIALSAIDTDVTKACVERGLASPFLRKLNTTRHVTLVLCPCAPRSVSGERNECHNALQTAPPVIRVPLHRNVCSSMDTRQNRTSAYDEEE